MRTLRLRRRAIDFVRKNHIAKQRAFHEAEKSFTSGMVFFENFRASDIAGHQIGRELHTAKRHMGQRRGDQQRFRQPWHPLQDAMPAAKKVISSCSATSF